MMMQSKRKENEVQTNVIDLTKTGTVGLKKKVDSIFFNPDSYEYWFYEVQDVKKLEIFLNKMNQTDKYFRFSSVEHVVEVIFNNSKTELYDKTKKSNEYLEFMPERKDQYVFEEKLKAFNENKEIRIVLKNESVATVTDDCLLDLEETKKMFISYTFLSLGFKSVPEIHRIIDLIIKYRCNLLYMGFLKQLSAPKKKDIKTIEELTEEDITIRKIFRDAMKKANNQTNALNTTLKDMGISMDDRTLFGKEKNRVRLRLERIGEWKTKTTKNHE